MKFLLVLLSNVLLLACTSGDGQALLTPSEFESKLKSTKGQLIDVRTSEEYKSEHIANALSLDFYSPKFDEEINKLDKSKTYFIYCQRGGRSTDAFKKFQNAGFKNVYELQGGIINWQKSNLAVEAGISEPKSGGLTLEKYNELVKSQKLVLVDFNAKWCGPCRKLSPIVEKIGKLRPNDVKIVLVDVDENEDVARINSVDELPTLGWYKDGKLVLRMIGLRTEKEINETVDKYLKE